LGIFTGNGTTLYIPVARSVYLTKFHSRLWTRLSRTARSIHTHHYGLPDIVKLLSKRSFNWNIHVDNLALVLDAQGTRDQWIRYPLNASPE
jgi:hypothetical protein